MIDPTSISQSNTILSELAEAIGSDLHQSETENFSRQAWLAVVVAHNTNISLFWLIPILYEAALNKASRIKL